MSSTWHAYDVTTGHFTGVALVGDAAHLADNTPAGCALVDGVADWQSQRVDLATGAVVDWTPPAPADTALATWTWHADARRWVATRTTAALALQVRAQRAAMLAACDWVVARATEQGAPVPSAWATYRQALRDIPEQEGFPATVVWPAQPTD